MNSAPQGSEDCRRNNFILSDFVHCLNFKGVQRYASRRCFLLHVKWEEAPNPLEPLERTQCLSVALSKGSTRLGASSHFTWRWKHIRISKRCTPLQIKTNGQGPKEEEEDCFANYLQCNDISTIVTKALSRKQSVLWDKQCCSPPTWTFLTVPLTPIFILLLTSFSLCLARIR